MKVHILKTRIPQDDLDLPVIDYQVYGSKSNAIDTAQDIAEKQGFEYQPKWEYWKNLDGEGRIDIISRKIQRGER